MRGVACQKYIAVTMVVGDEAARIPALYSHPTRNLKAERLRRSAADIDIFQVLSGPHLTP
jgi:hypothetical protein